MKKLVIAAAIVCAAATSQAATYEWNISIPEDCAGYKADGASLFSGQAYIFNTQVIDSSDEWAAQEILWNAIAGGTALDTLATTYGGVSITLTDGYNATPVKMLTDQSFGIEQNFLLVMKDGDNFFIDDPETREATTSPEGQDVHVDLSWTEGAEFVYDIKDGYQEGAWYTSAVPEPTSGLLLLLGVAGLALRRHRA